MPAPTTRQADVGLWFARSSILSGLPPGLLTRVNEIRDHRLSASSRTTVNAAMRIWGEVAELYGWTTMLQTDDVERGGKLVAFIMHMVDFRTDLGYSTIRAYEWGFRQFMQINGQADPILGVLGYSDFMSSVKVLTFVAGEPRRAIPMAVIRRLLEAADRNNFVEVQFVFAMLLFFFLYARSESGLPKTFNSFSLRWHWAVRDVQIRPVRQPEAVTGRLLDRGFAMGVKMKVKKTDQRLERPEAREADDEVGARHEGGSDWVFIGDVPGSIFSIFMWYRLLMTFYPEGRRPEEPMFAGRDRTRPYTYGACMADLKRMLHKIGVTIPYGLHGLRVEGYNQSRAANGEELTVAHGGWKSTAHKRYQRFAMEDVLGIAARMVGEDNPYDMQDGSDPDVPVPVPGAGTRLPPRRPVARGSGSGSAPGPVARGSGSGSAPPARARSVVDQARSGPNAATAVPSAALTVPPGVAAAAPTAVPPPAAPTTMAPPAVGAPPTVVTRDGNATPTAAPPVAFSPSSETRRNLFGSTAAVAAFSQPRSQAAERVRAAERRRMSELRRLHTDANDSVAGADAAAAAALDAMANPVVPDPPALPRSPVVSRTRSRRRASSTA